MSQTRIRSLGLEADSPLGLAHEIHEGLRVSKVEALLRSSGWNKSQLFAWAHIPPANGNRRFKDGRFQDHESERIARLARLFDAATEFLRDARRAAAWLQEPNPRLDGLAPVQAAGTELGAAEVEALIGRIRHGVY